MLRLAKLAVLMLFAAPPGWAVGAAPADGGIQARLSAPHVRVNAGDPVPVEFSIFNGTDEPQPLLVPGTEPEVVENAMGLPLAHVFSGEAFGALVVRGPDDQSWNVAVGYQPPARAPVVTLGPQQSIGITVDASHYYPAIRTPGTYRLSWSPYGGSVESNLLVIQVASLKEATIITDRGDMKMRFFYDDAPRHIDDFIELANKRFYDNLTFHRVESGFFIQGGCPNGDGTGIRPDGVKIPGEFSKRAQTRGTVSMALLDEDPNSASCQFFIANTDIPEWTGRYTIFGQLAGDASYEVLDKLMGVETDANGRPVQPLYIRTIRISDAPRDAYGTQASR